MIAGTVERACFSLSNPLTAWSVSNDVSVILGTSVTAYARFHFVVDSGGVTTSTVTVPLVTALGVGLAESIKGRNPMTDGFGLIAFATLPHVVAPLTDDAHALRPADGLARPELEEPVGPAHGPRLGGIEKADITGHVSYDPDNHEHMTKVRENKVAGIANDIPDATTNATSSTT